MAVVFAGPTQKSTQTSQVWTAAPAISAPASEDGGDLLARLFAAARRKRRLLSVHWEMTHCCNERCKHCYLGLGRPPARRMAGEEMGTEEGLALLAEIAALGALQVTFSGGEPLVRKDFWLLAREARRLRLGLRIFSNGLVLGRADGEDRAQQMADLHPLAVEISVYGAAAATHDAMTGVPGSWAAALRALERLRRWGVRTVWKTPIMRCNAGEIGTMAELAQQVGAAFRPDPLLTPQVVGDQAQRRAVLALRASEMELAGALAAWAAVRRQRCEPGRSTGPAVCTLGHSGLLVDPWGQVMPCVEVRDVVGCVRARPLRAIWEDAAAWRPYLALGETGVQGACACCAAAAWCARCGGSVRNETGDWWGTGAGCCAVAWARKRTDEGGMAATTCPGEEPWASCQ